MNLSNNAVVLLAAGNSSRMGSPKQLLEYRHGPLIRHAAEVAIASGCARVIVVLGANAAEIRPALAGLPVDIVENPRWQEGMGASINAGIRAAEARGLGGAILTLGDQPLITPEILRNLILEHQCTGQPIVASQYARTVGVPVYFAKEYFPHLLALAPEQGCKGVILKHREDARQINCPEAEADLDTPEDYAQLALSPS